MQFTYEAMNSSGREVNGTVEAKDNNEAIMKIRARGYFPTKVREKNDLKPGWRAINTGVDQKLDEALSRPAPRRSGVEEKASVLAKKAGKGLFGYGLYVIVFLLGILAGMAYSNVIRQVIGH